MKVLARFFQRRARSIVRFGRAEGGATAVEFAIIGPAFVATLVAVLQVCVFLFAQMAIQNAAVEAARYFMTGQAQNNNCTASQIINGGCGSLAGVCPTALFTCSKMYLVVQNYSSFSSASTSEPTMYNGSTPITSYAFDPGTQGDVMVVQLIYAWPVVSAPLGFNISNLPNNQTELMGVSAFRVEPY
jgi:Flp pilus assembly protein TadG